jgi:hypothetical protein
MTGLQKKSVRGQQGERKYKKIWKLAESSRVVSQG